MISEKDLPRVDRALAFLRDADPRLREEFRSAAALVRIPAGREVFQSGDAAESIALLISGVVRVYKIGESGREITLYRFGSGESCILTANAILSRTAFPAVATVESEAEAVLVPADSFREWMGRYAAWRDFVFALLSRRLALVMEMVEEVAFRRMDSRVAALLVRRGRAHNPLRITHQEIAAEIGSAREVISRILEGFASEGMVRPARNELEILDFAGLERRAAR